MDAAVESATAGQAATAGKLDLAPRWPGALTIGFGAAVAMWAVGYVGRFPGVGAPPALLAALFLVCFLGAGVVAGRTLGTLGAGAASGAIAGAIDVLIIASVARRELAGLAVLGSVGAGALLGTLGAAVGRRPVDLASPQVWTGRFARVTLAATLLLLAVGGLVTSHDAGLAVPDWPHTYGSNMFLFPLERMTGGIYYEHAHRLFGALVGLTTLAFTGLALATDRRPWVRPLAVNALALVVVQGLLGALRVTGTFTTSLTDTAPQLRLAVVHGVVGQLFFALLVLLAALTSRTWADAPPPQARESGETDLSLSGWLVAAVAVQLVLGALVRHYHVEPTWHICMAVAVVTLGGFAGVRAWGYHGDLPVLRRVGLGVAHALALQLLLGIGALVLTLVARPEGQRVALEVPIATAHQTLGAVILGLAVLLRAWLGRLVAPAPPASPAPAAPQAPSG